MGQLPTTIPQSADEARDDKERGRKKERERARED